MYSTFLLFSKGLGILSGIPAAREVYASPDEPETAKAVLYLLQFFSAKSIKLFFTCDNLGMGRAVTPDT